MRQLRFTLGMTIVKNRSSFLKGMTSYDSPLYKMTYTHTSLLPKHYPKYMLHTPKSWASSKYSFLYGHAHAGSNKSTKNYVNQQHYSLLKWFNGLGPKILKMLQDWSLTWSLTTNLHVQAVACLIFKQCFFFLIETFLICYAAYFVFWELVGTK